MGLPYDSFHLTILAAIPDLVSGGNEAVEGD